MTGTAGRRRRFSLLAKPAGAACNLNCSYCYFLSKQVLWEPKSQAMSSDTLRAWLVNYLDALPDGPVSLDWQGGEPTMRGLDFFREAVRLADELARPGQQLQHSIQTNATLLSDEWAEFLAEHRFLVGVSIDGPPWLHDCHRVNKAGRGSHEQVVRGLRILQAHGVRVNILCTVNAGNADHPLAVYRHFCDDLGVNFMQFIPIVERVEPGQEQVAESGWRDSAGEHVLYRVAGSQVTFRTVGPEQYGRFLTAIFDEWVSRDVGKVFVQDFDATLGALFGRHSRCVHAPECGTALVLDHLGEVYSCDHYVEPGFRLGNAATDDLRSMLAHPRQVEFGRAKRTGLPRQCVQCPVRWACHGGCPKDRFAFSRDGEAGLNYLCAGYFSFFAHVWPAVAQIGELIRMGRPAAEIMTSQAGSLLGPGSPQPESRR